MSNSTGPTLLLRGDVPDRAGLRTTWVDQYGLLVVEAERIDAQLGTVWDAIRDRHPELPAATVYGEPARRDDRNRRITLGLFSPPRFPGEPARVHVALDQGGHCALTTLLHEGGHALADARQLRDTHRVGNVGYHRDVYRKLARELGLVVDFDLESGWSDTSIPPGTLASYRPELALLEETSRDYQTWRQRFLAERRTREERRLVRKAAHERDRGERSR